MSLFATGNLAIAVCQYSVDVASTAATFYQVAKKCQVHVDSDDDKVSGNAIRSLGHIATIFISIGCIDYFNSTNLIDSAFDILTQKLNAAVLLGQSSERLNLTLKQRLALKKHGSGVCNAFSLLFQRFETKDCLFDRTQAIRLCSKPFLSMLECAGMISALLEKVAISALVALRSLHAGTCRVILSTTNSEDLLQKTLISCFDCVLETRQVILRSKVFQEAELTILHLLSCATDKVFECLVKSERLAADQGLIRLYHWLVSKEVASSIMIAFNNAIQTQNMIFNIQVERLFSNFVNRSQMSLAVWGYDEDEL
jgi:hypothetical protein